MHAIRLNYPFTLQFNNHSGIAVKSQGAVERFLAPVPYAIGTLAPISTTRIVNQLLFV